MMTWILSLFSKRSSSYKLQVMNDMQRELDENVAHRLSRGNVSLQRGKIFWSSRLDNGRAKLGLL